MHLETGIQSVGPLVAQTRSPLKANGLEKGQELGQMGVVFLFLVVNRLLSPTNCADSVWSGLLHRISLRGPEFESPYMSVSVLPLEGVFLSLFVSSL